MPLLDHFDLPLAPIRHSESFHARWAASLADALNSLLPDRYFAEPQTHSGTRVEIDVGAYETQPAGPAPSARDGNTATLPATTWSAATPALSMPGVCPEAFAVLVFHDDGGARLVGAIELASPRNKDRPAYRRAFAVKCASYLYQGISLLLVDIVTSRQANLHNEIVSVMENDARFLLPAANNLYAVAYRPVRRNQKEEVDLWPATLSLGQPLPTLPLFLGEEIRLLVDLEGTYAEACGRLKLT
jgi:Protein of unknown function (DUF4058)